MKHLTSVLESIKTPAQKLVKSQRGVTGLETAIILIAFVVVASVFAFTVLSTGIFSAERGKETVFAALKQARGSVELKSSVIANGVPDLAMYNDSAWVASSNVTATADATDKKEGTDSSDLLVATAFTTGLIAYENISPAIDMSSYDSIQFWMKSTVTTSATQLDLIIDDSTGCGSPSETIDIPVLTANTWKLVKVGITDSTTRTAIQCVGITVASDLSTTQDETITVDEIFARGQVTSIVITIANSIEGEAVDLTEPSDSNADGIADSEDRLHKLVVSYSDVNQLVNDLAWTVNFIGNNDADDLLEVGERAELTIDLKGLAQATPLIRNLQFDIEIKPIEGSTLIVERTMPSKIDTVVNLQ